MKKLILLISLGITAFSLLAQEECELLVKVENIKKVKGSLMIALYDHEENFLTKEVLSEGKQIDSSTVMFSFKGLVKGLYAVSIFQDENDNGKLDANFMGVPSEPYAFSNNAKGMFGPPKFEDCKFEVKGMFHEIVISL